MSIFLLKIGPALEVLKDVSVLYLYRIVGRRDPITVPH